MIPNNTVLKSEEITVWLVFNLSVAELFRTIRFLKRRDIGLTCTQPICGRIIPNNTVLKRRDIGLTCTKKQST